MQKCVWMSMKGQGLSSLKAEDTYFVVFKSHYTHFFLKHAIQPRNLACSRLYQLQEYYIDVKQQIVYH